MGDIIVWGIFALLVYSVILAMKDTRKEEKATNTLIQTGHTIVEYLGGSPHLNVVSTGALKPCENVLAFVYGGGSKPINTHWDHVKSMEVKTQEQITSDVTAGRVLLLGVFALAAKKQTVHKSEYLVIHCNEEGVDYDMVFSGANMGVLASRLSGALINYRKSKPSHKTVMARN